MHKRKSTLGTRDYTNRVILPFPIPSSMTRRKLGSGYSTEGQRGKCSAQLKPMPLIFTPAMSSTRSNKSQVSQFRQPANFTSGVKRNLFHKNKENVGPRYRSSPIQEAASSLKSASSSKKAVTFVGKLPPSPLLLQSAASRRYVQSTTSLNALHMPFKNETSVTPRTLTASPNLNGILEPPNLLRSTSKIRFSCITNPGTPRAPAVPKEKDLDKIKEDIASAVVAGALYKGNSVPSCSKVTEISTGARMKYSSLDKYTGVGHQDASCFTSSQNYQYVSGFQPLGSQNFRNKFAAVNFRLSGISERTESPPENYCEVNKAEVSDLQENLKDVTKNIADLNVKHCPSLNKTASKLPRFVRRGGYPVENNKSSSWRKDNSEIKTIATNGQQNSTKESIPKVNSEQRCMSDIFQSPTEIMTRSKRKKSLEMSVEQSSKKRFCPTNSHELLKNESEKSNPLQVTSKSGSSSKTPFCISNEGNETRNISHSCTDILFQTIPQVNKTNVELLDADNSTIESKTTSNNENIIMFNEKDWLEAKENFLEAMENVLQAVNQIDRMVNSSKIETDLETVDLSNKKNRKSTKCSVLKTPTRRSQRIAARMSNSSALGTPGSSHCAERNHKSSASALDKSYHMYKELKTDFNFLRTPKKSDKNIPMKSPGTLLSHKVQDQLKLLFD